jgi:ABC-type phosphate transport system substrate-binding protein
MLAMKIKFGCFAAAIIASSVSIPAFAELVIIVNPQNPATRLYTSQASQFFLGGSNMFTPVEQAENSPIRSEFYKKVLEKEPGQVKAIWSKLEFTGKAKAPREYKSSVEVKKAVGEDPKAIGYIEKSAVDDTVKVVTSVP